MKLAGFVIGSLAMLATTAFAVANWFGDVVKPAVTKQEYKTAQSELALPPGVTWPELNVDPNSVTSRGGGGSSAVMVAMGVIQPRPLVVDGTVVARPA